MMSDGGRVIIQGGEEACRIVDFPYVKSNFFTGQPLFSFSRWLKTKMKQMKYICLVIQKIVLDIILNIPYEVIGMLYIPKSTHTYL